MLTMSQVDKVFTVSLIRALSQKGYNRYFILTARDKACQK